MRRILLDANMPRGLLARLPAYEVRTAHRMGWSQLANGALLAAAEAEGFEAMITADRNIRYQQNLSGRRIALVELTTSHSDTVIAGAALIEAALRTIAPGGYALVTLPKPPRCRQVAR